MHAILRVIASIVIVAFVSTQCGFGTAYALRPETVDGKAIRNVSRDLIVTAAAAGKILVVDDEYGMRYFMSSDLSEAGYKVDEASSAEEAIELLETGKYVAVVTDWRMPGGGAAVIRFVNERFEEDKPLIFVATLSPWDVEEELTEGELSNVTVIHKEHLLRTNCAQIISDIERATGAATEAGAIGMRERLALVIERASVRLLTDVIGQDNYGRLFNNASREDINSCVKSVRRLRRIDGAFDYGITEAAKKSNALPQFQEYLRRLMNMAAQSKKQYTDWDFWHLFKGIVGNAMEYKSVRLVYHPEESHYQENPDRVTLVSKSVDRHAAIEVISMDVPAGAISRVGPEEDVDRLAERGVSPAEPLQEDVKIGEGKRILVADDELYARLRLVGPLSEMGYEVDTASNAREAIELIETRKYDAVVTDWVMPGLGLGSGGRDVVMHVKDMQPNARPVVIILTGGNIHCPGTDVFSKRWDTGLICDELAKIIISQAGAVSDRNIAIVGAGESDRLTIISWLRDMGFDVDNPSKVKLLETIDEAVLEQFKRDGYLVIQKTADGYKIVTAASEIPIVMSAAESLSDIRQRFVAAAALATGV